MRILCLIAFVFLATSFTTNNENFETVSNSENLEVVKPMEEYRVTAYERDYINNGWKKVTIKVTVTNSYGGEMLKVTGILLFGSWTTVNQPVNKTFSMTAGDAASQFDYQSGSYYFNM